MEQTNYKNNLKEIRLIKGFTQRKVAALMKMQCESRLSQWETGGATPSIYNLFRLCEIYKVSAHELFSPKDEDVSV